MHLFKEGHKNQDRFECFKLLCW